MSRHVAISVLGKDRPGIVAAVSKVLYETGCNIEDSSMTSLRSEFAMILLVALPQGLSPVTLKRRLDPAAKKLGLSISARLLSPDEEKQGKQVKFPHVISVYGADKPGIVYRISELLSKNRINITDVQTKISGKGRKTVYIMLLEIDVPGPVKLETLKSELDAIAEALNINITVHEVEEAHL